MSDTLVQAPKWFLDYEHYSLEEVRGFIKDRTGKVLNERVFNSDSAARKFLITYLRTLDQTATFPRFMELPTELRLNVYEHLLVDTDPRDAMGRVANNDDYKLHTAVLRTSKQVSSEATPILYDQNTTVKIFIGYTWEGSNFMRNDRCGLRIIQPGRKATFHASVVLMGCRYPAWRNFWTERGPPLDMLRRVKHMTIDLELIAAQLLLPDEFSYAAEVRGAVTAVCLMLAGKNCKVESLTIRFSLKNGKAGGEDLAEILWPLILLPTNVVVKFEGLAAVLQRQTSANREERARERKLVSPYTQATFPGLVSQIRKYCKEKTLWGPLPKTSDESTVDTRLLGYWHDDNRPHCRAVDKSIVDLNALGSWVDMADIMDLTPKWREVQSQADTLEVSGSTE